jgi:acetyl-CoA carboxylase carboxyl transferase alpha subunit
MKKRSAYERVLIARDSSRAGCVDYINALFTDFLELKGDRLGKEDGAILGGIALFHGKPVTVIGERKGKNLEDNMRFNFGMPQPEGYRKACRLMKQAEKFNRPVITFVDTPGAYPGIDAEAHGQSNAIAESMALMSTLKVPVITIITGEGNSGGALAIAVANEVWMMENAVYSILSPEGFASILWKDSTKMKDACKVMKMTAAEIKEQGFVEQVIPEPEEGITAADTKYFKKIDRLLETTLKRLSAYSGEELAQMRYERFRRIDAKYRPVRKGE